MFDSQAMYREKGLNFTGKSEMRPFIKYFLDRSIFVNLLSIITIFIGGWVAYNLNREAFPNVDFDIVVVTTVWPGASPNDVERLITNPIEESIKEVDGIKEYYSSSIESRSSIPITVDPDAEDTQKVIDDIRSAVDNTEDLPSAAEQPIITEISTSREPVIEWSLARQRGPDGRYQLSYKQLREIAFRLENKFLLLDDVARISRRGWRDAEIFVDLNPSLMRKLLIGGNDVVNGLRNRNVTLPGGDINLGKREVTIRTVGEFDSAGEIESVPVRANEVGSSIKVRDVAYVYEDFEEPEYIETTLDQDTIALTVVKREKADIIDVVDQTHTIVEEFKKTLEPGIAITDVNDVSYFVRRRLGVLLSNGFLGFILVVTVLFLFLGWRTALMVALGIPISFGTAIFIFPYLGITLNLISMFGLIIVLGIIVDDAIIVSENFYRYLEQGNNSQLSAEVGASEVFAPVVATITTSIAAFGPLLFMTGIFGKFVFTIPLVVILCLLASLFECFVILPSHLADMNRAFGHKGQEEKEREREGQEGKKEGKEEKKEERIEERKEKREGHFHVFRKKVYEPTLRFSLNHKALSLSGFMVLAVLAITLQALFGKFKLFPAAIDALYVKIAAPVGTSKEETNRFLQAIGHSVKKLPESELENYIGRSGIQTQGGGDPFTRRGNNYGMMVIYLHPELDRNMSADAVIDILSKETEWMLNPEALARKREKEKKEQSKERQSEEEQNEEEQNEEEQNRKGEATAKKEQPVSGKVTAGGSGSADSSAFNKKETQYDIPVRFRDLHGQLVNLEFEKLQGGPPVGKPVAIEIQGDEFSTLEKIAEEYKELLAKIPGVRDIDDSFLPKQKEIHLRVNEDTAAQTGVSVLEVATAVNTGFEGAIATSIRRPNEEVDIRVRYNQFYRNNLGGLQSIYLTNRQGNLIPIAGMAKFENKAGLTAISHLNGRRLVTVTANINEETTTSSEVTGRINSLDDAIVERYPNYTIQFGGENRDTEESLESLQRAFFVGLLIIFMVLASLFRSLVKPFVVLTAIPFCLIGVFFAFVIHNQPIGFLSLLGVVGLTGVVVNDSIVLVDFANRMRRQRPDISNKELVLAASSTRLRAVLLTTFTTVGGLLPTVYGIGGYDPFLVPMALAFAWGLAFSTILILGLVPILYNINIDVEDKLHAWRQRRKG